MSIVRQYIGNLRGPRGATFTPHISQELDLSFTNDGGLSNPETVSLKSDPATTSADGLMSAADKAKLDGIPADATNNAGTITEIRMNGVLVSAGGVADLGTVITDVSGKLDASRVGAANGVAELDASGKVPAAQLPSYVDDVLEYAAVVNFPATGETGKIYVAVDTNLTYRWSGSGYTEISPSLALGETSATAYRGDRGKIAYDHSQATGNAHSMTKADIGLGNVDNTSDANKPISTAQQAALNLKVDKVTGKGLSTEDYTTAEKNKLSGIESGANATTIDAALSNSGQAADAKATGDNLAALRAENALLRELVNGIDAPIYRTKSGNPATFDDGYAANVRNLVVTLTPTQSGSGDPSPDNIRPISGATSVSVAAHNAPSNVVTITPTQSGSGDPSPTNIRPISGVDCGQAGTVYGGTLDVATGTLTVNAIKIAVSENWGYSTEDGRYVSNGVNSYGLESGSDNQLRGALCSHFKEAQ